MDMKRILTFLAALVITLSVTGCGADITSQELWQDYVANFTEEFAQTESEPNESVFADNDGESLNENEANTATAESTLENDTNQSAQDYSSESASCALPALDENGSYTTRDDVALYLHLYGHLPQNFITKKQAQELGWNGGSLEPYAPGKCIGGSRFGNYEGLLPEKDGRSYTECDIDTLGADSRGAKRIVFSNDGLIYYTDDHYASFTLLYGEE